MREKSDSLTSLVKQIDQRMQLAAHKTPRPLGAFVMFMNDAPGLDQGLRALAEKEAIKQVPLGIGAPPPDYAIAPEADMTVVVYPPGRRGDQRVSANFALRKGELDDAKADAIVKAIAAVLPHEVVAVVPTSRDKEQSWRYTFARPADHWFKPDFNDLSWKTGPGGFGNRLTPGSVDRTPWHTNEIWLRREIILPDGPFTHLQLQLHADDYADVYLNGVLAAKVNKCTPGYVEVAISEKARKTLRPGSNVLAVNCRDTGGGRYIDVGLVEPVATSIIESAPAPSASRLDGENPYAGGVVIHVVASQQIDQPGVELVFDGPGRAATRLDYRETGHRWGAAAALILHFGVGIEVGPGVDDLHCGKSRFGQLPAVVSDGDSSSDATDVGHQILANLGWQRLLEGNIADRQSSSRFQHPGDFSEHGGLVRSQIDDAVAYHTVHRSGRQRQLVDIRLMELDIPDRLAVSALGGILTGKLQHLSGHIDTDCLASRADLRRRQEDIEATTTPEVHHNLAGPKVCGRRGIPTRQAHVGLRGNGGQFLG